MAIAVWQQMPSIVWPDILLSCCTACSRALAGQIQEFLHHTLPSLQDASEWIWSYRVLIDHEACTSLVQAGEHITQWKGEEFLGSLLRAMHAADILSALQVERAHSKA